MIFDGFTATFKPVNALSRSQSSKIKVLVFLIAHTTEPNKFNIGGLISNCGVVLGVVFRC